jgi:hypothetical protein
LYFLTEERREALRIPTGLKESEIPARLHSSAAERLNSKIVRVATDPADTDLFPLDVFGFLDVAAGNDALGHDIFYPGDKDQIRSTLEVSTHVADAARQRHFRIAAEYRRRNHAR